MEQKIQLIHPEGKKAVSMSRDKYDLLKKTFLDHLKENGESTFTDIWKTTAENFKKNKIKFNGSVQWHMEWVKLDLEANKIVKRIAGTSPQSYVLEKE